MRSCVVEERATRRIPPIYGGKRLRCGRFIAAWMGYFQLGRVGIVERKR